MGTLPNQLELKVDGGRGERETLVIEPDGHGGTFITGAVGIFDNGLKVWLTKEQTNQLCHYLRCYINRDLPSQPFHNTVTVGDSQGRQVTYQR